MNTATQVEIHSLVICSERFHIATIRVLNLVVYKISWISWYASDPQKFHKTILETHIDSTMKIIPTKFNTLANKPTTKILPTKFNTCMVASYILVKLAGS